MLVNQEIHFSAGPETLQGTLQSLPNSKMVKLISLHGAGPSNRARIGYLTNQLANQGISSFRFDYSGHGDSTGELHNSSLQKRLEETQAAINQVELDESGICLIGTSMGGHIAARLCNQLNVDELVLICPAAYGKDTESLQFNESFSAAIRQPSSYKNAQAFEDIKSFKGGLTLIIGDKDDIIPAEVVDMYMASAMSARHRTLIKLKDAPHAIHGWIEKNPKIQAHIVNYIHTLCNATSHEPRVTKK